jgi:predicted nucleotidyltransferase
MIALVTEKKPAIAELCRDFGVYRLDLFGSAASGDFKPETSDLDFIVNFWDRSPGYAKRFLSFAEALEALFGRDVDLVTEASITNPYFREMVDSHRENVFEDPDREAAARRADLLQ